MEERANHGAGRARLSRGATGKGVRDQEAGLVSDFGRFDARGFDVNGCWMEGEGGFTGLHRASQGRTRTGAGMARWRRRIGRDETGTALDRRWRWAG